MSIPVIFSQNTTPTPTESNKPLIFGGTAPVKSTPAIFTQPTQQAPQAQPKQNLGQKISSFITGVKDKLPKISGVKDIISTIVNTYKKYQDNTIDRDVQNYSTKIEEEKSKPSPNQKKISSYEKSIGELNSAKNAPEIIKKSIINKERDKRLFQRYIADLGTTTIAGITDFIYKTSERDAELMGIGRDMVGQPKWLSNFYGDEARKSEVTSGTAVKVSDGVKLWAKEVNPTNPTFVENLAGGAGSMSGFMLLSLATGAPAEAMSMLEAMQESGNVYYDNRKKGMSIAEASKLADKDFFANIVINYFTNKYGLFSDKAKGLKKTLMSFQGEGLQEAYQQIASNITTNRPLMEGVWESFFIGGALGGTASVVLPNGDVLEITGEGEKIVPAGSVTEKEELTPTEALQKMKEPVQGTPNIKENVTKAVTETKAIANEAVDTMLSEASQVAVPTGKERFYQITNKEGTDWLWKSPEELKSWAETKFTKGETVKYVDLKPNQAVKQSNGAYKMVLPKSVKLGQKKVVAPQGLDALAQEARKYKSAEDFVKNNVVEMPLDKTKPRGGLGETTDPLSYDKLTTTTDKSPIKLKYTLTDGTWTIMDGNTRIRTALANGDKTIKANISFWRPQDAETFFNQSKVGVTPKPKIALGKTKTKVVEKVTIKPKTVSVPRTQLPVGEGDKTASRLEARVKKTLDNVTQDQIDALGLSTFKQMNNEDQIAKASEYVVSNPNEALEVLKGNVEPPKGLLKNSIYVAMVNNSIGKPDLINKLASLSSTRFGQEIEILKMLDKDSPVKWISELYKIRADAVEKKYKTTVKEAVTKEATKIENEVKAPSKYDWDSFIKGIEC